MGKLRKFEIDAVIATIKDKVEAKNAKLVPSEKELEKEYAKCPLLQKAIMLEEAYQKASKANNDAIAKLKDKYYPGQYCYQGDLYMAKNAIKATMIAKLGAISLDSNSLENKIIIMSSSGDLAEIIENLSKELGL